MVPLWVPVQLRFGPFVYRLGRKIFILERAVRFCYGLPQQSANICVWRFVLCYFLNNEASLWTQPCHWLSMRGDCCMVPFFFILL